MITLNSFSFFKDRKTIGDSEILSNPNMGSSLILQINGSHIGGSLSVMGTIENNENWNKLAIIDMSTFQMVNNINKNGIYTIAMDGVAKVKVVLNGITSGNISVFGKLGY